MTEKCKQYIKSDGLNFCMSSVCPEKDCIYALVNKLHQKIDGLEQENKELKEQLLDDKMLDEHIENLSREDIYRSALEEIKKIIKSYDLTVDNGASVNTLYTIRKIINEVLG